MGFCWNDTGPLLIRLDTKTYDMCLDICTVKVFMFVTVPLKELFSDWLFSIVPH